MVMTDPKLGLAITIILGTSALLMAFKGMKETEMLGASPSAKANKLGGRTFVLLTPPLVFGALAYALFQIYA